MDGKSDDENSETALFFSELPHRLSVRDPPSPSLEERFTSSADLCQLNPSPNCFGLLYPLPVVLLRWSQMLRWSQVHLFSLRHRCAGGWTRRKVAEKNDKFA
uniref:Uncharacterized protein n=1 Tax=Romanomermis culicivorax TaxID=13658 RepID=A0A915I755_ROMCU